MALIHHQTEEQVFTSCELAGLAYPSKDWEHSPLIEMVTCEACVQAVQGMTDAETQEFVESMRETVFCGDHRDMGIEPFHPLDILRTIRKLGYRVTKA